MAKFFANLCTPVDDKTTAGVQTAIYKLLGALCMVYGGFILLLMAILNKSSGRLQFPLRRRDVRHWERFCPAGKRKEQTGGEKCSTWSGSIHSSRARFGWIL